MEVAPFQTTEDKLYFSVQRGDEEMSELKPSQKRLFNGMVGRLFSHEWDVKPCISSYNQGETMWFSVPRTPGNESALKEMCTPYVNGIYTGENEDVTNKFRRTKEYFNIDKLSKVQKVKDKEPDFKNKFYSHKHRIGLIELDGLPTECIRDSSEIDILRPLIDDVGQITTGLYTVGPAAGDNYPTYANVGGFVAAIGANQTGNLTGQNTGPITEIAVATINHNLAGFTFDICSNVDHLGNYNSGHLITVAQNSQLLNISVEQAGIINVRLIKFIRTVLASAATRAFVLFSNNLPAAQTLNVFNNLGNMNSLSGCFFRSSDPSNQVRVFSNISWGGAYGITIDAADGNPLSVYENNSFYNNTIAGVEMNNNGGTIRNIASIGNLANYSNIGAATVQASPAALVAANEWQSLVAADGDTFLLPIAGSEIDQNGVVPTYATTLINGVPWVSEIGAKGIVRPSGGRIAQPHIAITNSISIM